MTQRADCSLWQRRAARIVAATGLFIAPVLSAPQRAAAQVPVARPGGEASLAAIARAVTPAVVSIESEFAPAVAARMQQREGIPPGLMPPQGQSNLPARAGGTGFLVTADGYILTNNHVVADASRVTVTLLDRRIFTATVVGRDPTTDVGLIKIDGAGFPTIPLGDDSTAEVGDGVLAVGNPLGLDFTVTSGIVSAKGRAGGLRSLFGSDYAIVDFIQTDAVINPGNSGGPLIDMHGRVIGINSAIESPTGLYAGYGFAIPVGIARVVMAQFRQYGHIRRGLLGISLQDVTPADARAAGMREIRGALVGGFTGPDSPARRAGLQEGDIILDIDGRPVDRASRLQRIILGDQPGQTVRVRVMRFGTERTANVTLAEVPAPTQVADAPTQPEASSPAGRLGVEVAPITRELAAQLGFVGGTPGVAVGAVDPSGPSSGLLFPGDIIAATLGPAGAHQPVSTLQDLQRAITAASNGVVSLLVVASTNGGSPRGRSTGSTTRVVTIALSR